MSKIIEKTMMVILPKGFFEEGGTLEDLPNGNKKLEFGEGLARYKQIYPAGSAVFSQEGLQNATDWSAPEPNTIADGGEG